MLDFSESSPLVRFSSSFDRVPFVRRRCESDGLLVALRNLCKENVWRASELATHIMYGPSAQRTANHAPSGQSHGAMWAAPKEGEKLLEEELLFWLNARDLRYTEPSLAFFLHTVGFDGKGKESRPLSVARFTSAFEAAKVHVVEI